MLLKDVSKSYNNSIVVFNKEFKYVEANKYIVSKSSEHSDDGHNIFADIGNKIANVYPGIKDIETFEVFKNVMETRISKVVVEKVLHPSGEVLWYEHHVIPVNEGIMVFAVDITDRTKKQNAIMENELKYRSLVEQSYDGIILINEYGIIVEFNNRMESLSGVPKQEAIGKYIWELIYELSSENVKNYGLFALTKDDIRENFMANLNKEDFSVKNSMFHRKDGEVIYVENTCYPIVTDKIRYTCCIWRDVTELKKLQEIKEKAAEKDNLLKEAIEMDKLKTEFFANLSHEFRTPLNIILGSNDMLLESIENNKDTSMEFIKKYLRVSKQNCYRLLRLINNIIDVTKIDAGFLHIDFKCYNIVSVVEDITQSIVEYAQCKDIEVIFDTDVEEKYILCDVDKIERVILNLLSNSMKFTNRGGKIEVSVTDGEDYVTIKVTDSGIGIPEEKLSIIFDRFRQVDKSMTRSQEGSGIGLALVKSLVELHNATIEVCSTVGIGTEFTICLPAKNLCEQAKAMDNHIYDDRVEKASIEFSDIYY